MGGMPCIRGMRLPGATVVAMVADGMSTDEILADLPYLETEDIAGGAPLRGRDAPRAGTTSHATCVKFLVDLNLSPHLARRLLEADHDAVHCADLELFT